MMEAKLSEGLTLLWPSDLPERRITAKRLIKVHHFCRQHSVVKVSTECDCRRPRMAVQRILVDIMLTWPVMSSKNISWEGRDDKKHNYIFILHLDDGSSIGGTSITTLPSLNFSCQTQLYRLPTMTISTQSSALFPTLDGRLARNAEWAESIQCHTPDYFKDLVKGQQPEILWFGCESHPSLSATVV